MQALCSIWQFVKTVSKQIHSAHLFGHSFESIRVYFAKTEPVFLVLVCILVGRKSVTILPQFNSILCLHLSCFEQNEQ